MSLMSHLRIIPCRPDYHESFYDEYALYRAGFLLPLHPLDYLLKHFWIRLCVDSSNTLVGFMICRKEHCPSFYGPHLHLYVLWVVRNHRHQGIGSFMMNWLLNARSDCLTVVWESSNRVESFYSKFGSKFPESLSFCAESKAYQRKESRAQALYRAWRKDHPRGSFKESL